MTTFHLYGKLSILCLALVCVYTLPSGKAAAECQDIYADAKIGPPPGWNFWDDGSACYVIWQSKTLKEREKLHQECRNTRQARYIHFENLINSDQSVCIFKIVG